MKIVWSKKSERQLLRIYEYISEDSAYYAKLTTEKIISRAEDILAHPNQGRIVPEFKQENIREVFVHPYRIIYRVDSDIQIITIIHEARLLS